MLTDFIWRQFLYLLPLLMLTGFIAGCSSGRDLAATDSSYLMDNTAATVVNGTIFGGASGGHLVTVVAPPNARLLIMTDEHGHRQTIKLHAQNYAENLGAFVFTLNTEPPLTPSVQREIVAQINIIHALRSMTELTHYRRFITIDKNGHTVTLDLAKQNYDDNILSVVITLNDLNHHAEEFNFVIDRGRTIFVDLAGQTITLMTPIMITVGQKIDFVPTVHVITNTIEHPLTIRQTIAVGDAIPAESVHLSIAPITINATLTIKVGGQWHRPEDFHLPAGKTFMTITITKEKLITVAGIHFVTVAGDGIPSDLITLTMDQTGGIFSLSRQLARAILPTITIILRGEDNTILGTMTITIDEYDMPLTIAEITVYDDYVWALFNTVTVPVPNITVGIFAASGLPAFAILPPPNPSDGKNYRTAEFHFGGGLDNINADAAYQRGYFGQGVTVAILDTGLLTSHIEFAGRVVPGWNYQSGGMRDDYGHGTHVAGIIGGNINGTLFHGVAPSVAIMPLRFSARPGKETDRQAIDAMTFAIAREVDVINNSWGDDIFIDIIYPPEYDFTARLAMPFLPFFGDAPFANFADFFRDVVDLMADADVIQVFAAGNNGWNSVNGTVYRYWDYIDLPAHFLPPVALETIISTYISPQYGALATLNLARNGVLIQAAAPLYYPSLLGKWLAVVATDDNDTIAWFSNGCGAAKYWCLAAPGVDIWSADSCLDENFLGRLDCDKPEVTVAIDYGEGTSFAAPHVSGALALLMSRLPQMPKPVIQAILLKTATDLGEPGVDEVYGHGLVNVAAAITVQGSVGLALDECNNCREPPEKNKYGIYENSIHVPPPNPSDGKNYRTAEFNVGGGLDNINADVAYQRGYFGQGVTVAVVDSGLLTTHFELAGRTVPGYDFLRGTNYVTDFNGHGTQVAGIIGGAMDGERFHGVAPSVQIMPLRAVDDGRGSTAQILDAMRFAISNGVHVINNSWGQATIVVGKFTNRPQQYSYRVRMPRLPQFMGTAFFSHFGQYFDGLATLMTDADVIQVYAAGNDGWNTETGSVRIANSLKTSVADVIDHFISDDYGAFATLALDHNGVDYNGAIPLNYDSLIGKWLVVVATDDNDTIASFSNGCGAAKYWCVAAPGVDIWSALPLYGELNTGIYRNFGTSMAAPHVSGALALLISRLPQMPKPMIKAILLATATDLGEAGVDDVYGHGLVNVAAAITVQGEIILVDNDDANHHYNAVANAHKRMNLSPMMTHLHQTMAHLSVAFNVLDDYYFGASYQSFITPQTDNILPLGNAAADLLGDSKTEIEMLDARKLPTFFAAADDEHFLYYGAETQQWRFRYDLCTDCGEHLWTPKTDSFAKPFFATQQAAAAFTWRGVNGWSPFIAIDTEGEDYQQFGLQWQKENAMAHWGAEISHIREQGKVLGSDFGDGYFAVVDDGRATQMRAFIRRDLWNHWSGFAEYQWGRGADVDGEILLKQLSSLRFDGWQLGLAGKSAIMHGDRLRLSMTKPTAMRGTMQAHHCAATKPVMVEDLQYHLNSDYECEIVAVNIDAPRTMIYALGYELPSRAKVRTAIGLEYRDRAEAHDWAASFALRWAL